MPLVLEVSLNHWSLNLQTDFCFISKLNPNCAEETRVDALRRAPFPSGCERGASSLAMGSIWPLPGVGQAVLGWGEVVVAVSSASGWQ